MSCAKYAQGFNTWAQAGKYLRPLCKPHQTTYPTGKNSTRFQLTTLTGSNRIATCRSELIWPSLKPVLLLHLVQLPTRQPHSRLHLGAAGILYMSHLKNNMMAADVPKQRLLKRQKENRFGNKSWLTTQFSVTGVVIWALAWGPDTSPKVETSSSIFQQLKAQRSVPHLVMRHYGVRSV